MRVRLVCAGTALLGLVAACGGGESDDPGSLPPVSVAPSVAASPTAEAVPSAAAVATADGAAEFARFFYTQVAEGFQTHNPDLVARISLPSCETCTKYVDSIQSVKDDGLRVEGGDFTVSFAVAPALQGDEAVVDVGWDFAPVAYFDATGKQVDQGPAVRGVEESMTLKRRGDSWVVARLIKVRQRS